MAARHPFSQITGSLSHLPTWLLIIGYPVFWLEMYVFRPAHGVASPLAWVLFMAVLLLVGRAEALEFKNGIQEYFRKADRFTKVYIALGFALVFFILGCVLYAAILPPHLVQESDALNYHLTLPRQHLLLGSFAHIPWSADDLFLLPVDHALAPFWLAHPVPNKFPQFLFLLGLIFVLIRLARRFGGGQWSCVVLVLFAFMGSHGFGIQMGTAMMDLVVCYLFFAALDSLLAGSVWLFTVESVFFVCSKPVAPLQIAVLAVIMLLLFWGFKRAGFRSVLWDFENPVTAQERQICTHTLKKALPGSLLLLVFVAGPFMARSFYCTGSPLFPVGVSPKAGQSLLACADFLNNSIHDGRYGRSFLDFLTHFWSLAVPDKGVNNAFDYPMGLPYLLFLGPFLFLLYRSIKNKQVSLLSLLVAASWVLWWFSAREARHLYCPVLLIFLTTAVYFKKPSKVLMTVILLALALNAVSIFRAHRADWGRPWQALVLPEDRKIMDFNEQYIREGRKDAVHLENYALAYARFPAVVTKESLPHIVGFQ